MSNKKNCGHSVPCGCEDTPLTTPPPCGDGIDCPNPDPCPETFCDECLVHCGDTIVDLDIVQGDRMDVILQRLAIFLTGDANCVTPGNTCQSVLGLKSTSITSGSIVVSWLPSSTATQYQVEYKEASAVTWTVNPVKTPTVGATIETDTILGLLPDTDYHIRVITTCAAGGPCQSVTILVRTKI